MKPKLKFNIFRGGIEVTNLPELILDQRDLINKTLNDFKSAMPIYGEDSLRKEVKLKGN